jgi:hypothetical protein
VPEEKGKGKLQKDASLTRAHEAAEILRCLHQTLREPLLNCAVIRFLAQDGRLAPALNGPRLPLPEVFHR